MLTAPPTLHTRPSIPASLRAHSTPKSTIQSDARILNSPITAFLGQVTSLDNRTWFVTHPQNRTQEAIQSFRGVASGDVLEVEDPELEQVGKRQYIWKVWGRIGRVLRFEKGHIVYVFKPYWVRYDNDNTRITTSQSYRIAIPYHFTRPSTFAKWLYSHHHHHLPSTLSQQPTSNPQVYTPPPRFWNYQRHHADRISWEAPRRYTKMIEESVNRS